MKKELCRKIIHLLTLLVVVAFILILSAFGKQAALFFLLILLIFFLIIEYFRIELKKRPMLIHFLYRKKEEFVFGGQIFFLIGMILSFSIFDFKIALAAILMAILGDMASALVGKSCGKIWLTKKRALEGILAEFVVDLIIAYFLLGNLYIAIAMAVTATLVEAAIDKLDDNLFVPIFSGFVGQLLDLLRIIKI